MQIVDAHHHLWDIEALSYPWLESEHAEAPYGDYRAIQRSYLIAEYLADTAHQSVVKSVHVQAEHDASDPVAETRWLQSIADDPCSRGFPHGIVAHADFTSADVERVLSAHHEYANIRGIRQILSHHTDPRLRQAAYDYLSDSRWRQRIGLLAKYGFSFDLQLYPHQMANGAALAAGHAGTLFVLNHAGTPAERDAAGLERWRQGMRQLAACDNVVAKISGLGIFDPHWTVTSIRPFVLETIEIFGTERCMFASNFPVDKLFSDYDTLFAAYKTITAVCSETEGRRLFHDNAVRYYRL